MPNVTIAQIKAASHAALSHHGAEDWIADAVAQAVARAESLGNVICGLYYLESYCSQLTSGRVSGTVEPVISRPKSGAVRADAMFGFALACSFARGLPEAVAAARENGVAILGVANAHTCTSLGFFYRTDRGKRFDRDRIYQCVACCSTSGRQCGGDWHEPDRD